MLTGSQTNPAVERVMHLARAKIEAQADALKVSGIPSGFLDQMLAHAKGHLSQLDPQQLAHLRTGSSQLTDIAAASFRSVVGARPPEEIKAMFALGAMGDKSGAMRDGLEAGSLSAPQRQFRSGTAGYADLAAEKASSTSTEAYRSVAETKSFVDDLVRKGFEVGWMKEAPGILRLGSEAVRLIAEARMELATYKIAKEKIGLKDETTVSIVRKALAAGKDPKDAIREMDRNIDALVGDGPDAKARRARIADLYDQLHSSKRPMPLDEFSKHLRSMQRDEKGREAAEKLIRQQEELHKAEQKAGRAFDAEDQKRNEEKLRAGQEKLKAETKTAKSADLDQDLFSAAMKPDAAPKTEAANLDASKTPAGTTTAKVDAKGATAERPKAQTASIAPKAPTPAA